MKVYSIQAVYLRKITYLSQPLLVGERETFKITDFGMARHIEGENIYERKTKVNE